MCNINIEEIIIKNFNKLVEYDKLEQEELQKYINQINEGLKLIKQNNQLEVLTSIYLIEEKLHNELNQSNKKIIIKYSKTFEDVTTAIFFSLGYKQGCSSFGYSEDNIYTIIEVPKEYEQEIITILNDNFCNWKDKIKLVSASNMVKA